MNEINALKRKERERLPSLVLEEQREMFFLHATLSSYFCLQKVIYCLFNIFSPVLFVIMGLYLFLP